MALKHDPISVNMAIFPKNYKIRLVASGGYGLCPQTSFCDMLKLRQFPQHQKLQNFLDKKILTSNSRPHFSAILVTRLATQYAL